MLSQQPRQTAYVRAVFDACLLCLAFVLAFSIRSYVPLPFFPPPSPLSFAAHFWRHRWNQRLLDLTHDILDTRNGIGIGRTQVARFKANCAHAGNNNQSVTHVIEDNQIIAEEQHHVGHIEIV